MKDRSHVHVLLRADWWARPERTLRRTEQTRRVFVSRSRSASVRLRRPCGKRQIASVYLIAESAATSAFLLFPPPLFSGQECVFLRPLTSFSCSGLCAFFPKPGAFERFVREQFTFQRFVLRNARQEGRGQKQWFLGHTEFRETFFFVFFFVFHSFSFVLVQRVLKGQALTGHEFMISRLHRGISERQTSLMRERCTTRPHI